jgi:hypothetical protein
MKNVQLLLGFILIICTLSCEKKEDSSGLSIEKISGYVQKGPYLNGTSITISELSEDLTPTGKNFSSQILDNKGTFEIRNVELSSQYVLLKADGFYFDEVKNDNSAAQLTLFALSDLTDKTSLNINVLSSLEKTRVEYLVSNGMDYSSAKKQAQSEILSIFEISKSDLSESELLDITKTGDENAILMAVSVILKGYLSVSELSELLANISTDIREDGVLNSHTLATVLINNAVLLKPDDVRKNIENRYEMLGMDIIVADFEKYVNRFIDSTSFEFSGYIEYPASGLYGTNLLDKQKTEYAEGDHSLCAILPEGTILKVTIQGNNWFYPVSQDWSGWIKTVWNDVDNSRTFLSKKTGEIDLNILLQVDTTTFSKTNIYVYENNDVEPTWSKEISVY